MIICSISNQMHFIINQFICQCFGIFYYLLRIVFKLWSISFSQRHTKKVWKPNLQTKTVVVDGKKVTLKISTQAIRTLKKKGLLTPTGAAPTA